MGFPTEKQLGQCYLNIEIFLLEIDIVMSFVSYVILCNASRIFAGTGNHKQVLVEAY
jgi:hypothetical protein